ncbi:hypothetical protein N482_21760 [Pseudoalteromonas luteoviolacea NCIMB 1942]|uniref:Uncharacterized protein n=1 Tax=Pseudoalteromonas luteoviolacea NCIMB 1942 TaxID=1365253 RepID=A0A167HUZ7_9GAMM|nr:hypothetical protein N482_21760 [Pseudoalteromonas luteoviolacea NCIMB 1942]
MRLIELILTTAFLVIKKLKLELTILILAKEWVYSLSLKSVLPQSKKVLTIKELHLKLPPKKLFTLLLGQGALLQSLLECS